MNQNILKKSKTAFKFTFIFKILTQASGFIATVLLVRALSEHDYGIYNLLYSVIALIGMVASLGISNTLQRYIPEYYEKGEFRIAHNLFKASSFIRLLSNVAVLGLILLLWQQIAPVFKITEYKTYFMLFTLVILLHKQREILETCLSSYFLHKYSKAAGFAFSIIKAIGYSYIIISDKSLWAALIIDILAYTVVFLSLQVIYNKKIPVSTGSFERFTREEKKRVAKYALFYNFNDAGVGLLDANFDNFIIVMFLNPVAVGAYAFSVKLTKQINNLLPFHFFKDVIQPSLFSAGTSSNTFNTTLFFQMLVKINFVISIPILFLLILYSRDLILILFNGKFIEYSNILCGVFFVSFVNLLPVGLIAQLKEKANIVLYSKIFAFYNLIADIVLIKMFGIWGAVIATGTATLGKNLFIWYFVREEASLKGTGGFFLKIICFWIIFSIPVYFTNNMIPQSLYRILFGFSLFAVAFIVRFKCNYFNINEKEICHKFIGTNSKYNFIFKLFRMIPESYHK